MNISIRTFAAIGVLLVASSQTVWAHDPAEHAKEATANKAKANCAAMQKMDMSKMSMDDPVMQAMHAKCAKQAAPKHKPMKDMNHADRDHSKMNMPATSTAPASSAEHKQH